MGVRVRGDKKQVHAAGRAIFGCITVWHDEKKKWLKMRKNEFQSNKNYAHPVVTYPWNTRNRGYGCGMPRYTKVHYRTRTRGTRFGNTAGFSVPVLNPTHKAVLYPTSILLPQCWDPRTCSTLRMITRSTSDLQFPHFSICYMVIQVGVSQCVLIHFGLVFSL